MIPLIVTLITSALEIADQVFATELAPHTQEIAVFLAVITPILVWAVPNIDWRGR
jgi:hypothetical protein